ncbi:metallophosphoesterase [Anaerostipes butyraticus]|uniref:Phosphoesterase n=1 Tax=Anaerostipes butyraticus TaxID=645466 RepID=A0A916VDJ6_9FIRM|nr:metallophosphoesterase [Anaerostipes butyraticus]GFO85870.1 phosphoesterase [Anaerostipes butyraticus]
MGHLLKRRKRIFMAAGIVLAAVIAIAVFIKVEIYISYNSLEAEEYTISSDRINSEVKLALISDLHDHTFGEKNEELVQMLKGQGPDLILMAGDMINDISKDSHVAVELIEQVKDIAPVYYSLGNQEEDYIGRGTSDLLNELKEAGAIVLDESYQDIQVNGNAIRLGGMYDYAFALDGNNTTTKESMRPSLYQFLTDFQDTDSYRLMMAHRPDSFIFGDAAKTWDIDLVVSGHNHGGQVILPVLGGIYGGDQGWFPKYVDGIHHFKTLKNMIITRGLGSGKEKLPRFNNKPEVVIIHLEKE